MGRLLQPNGQRDCQLGAKATTPGRSDRWPLPSAFIANSSRVPLRLLRKAIWVPSGDQTGAKSYAGSVVSWIWSDPSASTIQMSPKSPGWLAKATF